MAEVTFSSIHVSSGQELGDTPQVFVQVAGKRAPRAGETLIVFLDLPNASAATYSDVARTLSDGYWRAPGGMTTALRLAIKLASDRLIELNRGLPSGQRADGSLTCAVVNDQSVVLAQTGPAIAFARAQTGAFERVAPLSPLPPVGVNRNIDTFFTHFAWKPGDTFVLTGASSFAQVSDELVNACMGKGDARMVAGYLNANVKEGHMTGVAFSIKGQPASVLAGTSPAPLAAADTAGRSASRAGSVAQAAPQPVRPLPAAVAGAAAGSSRDTMIAEGDVEEHESRTTQVLGTAGAAVSSAAGTAARSVQRSLSAFGAQLLPAPSPRAKPLPRSRATVFGLAAAAILLPIVVAMIVAVTYYQLSGDAEKQQLRNQTREKVELARSTSNKANWTAALSMIKDYQTKYPDDAAAFNEDKHQGEVQLDQIGKVTRVTPAALVSLNPASAARRIAAGSLGVYVLDPGTNSAEYHVLNVQRNGVTGKPVPLSPASGVTTANVSLRDITWATPSSGRWRTEGALLFSSSALYEYSSATGQMVALNLPGDANSMPGQVVAGELYNGTAYLLDAGIGQIWRYTVQGGKLVKGESYFRSPYKQLQDTVDIAIDGAIYMLQKGGTILRYFNRSPLNFSLNAGSLPEPMGKTIAIAVNGPDPNNGNLFIADASNGAVWQFTKAGEFVKQYRGANDEFVGMQDMSLDPTSNTIYINTGDKLYSFRVG
jgi:hypothetical protein